MKNYEDISSLCCPPYHGAASPTNHYPPKNRGVSNAVRRKKNERKDAECSEKEKYANLS